MCSELCFFSHVPSAAHHRASWDQKLSESRIYQWLSTTNCATHTDTLSDLNKQWCYIDMLDNFMPYPCCFSNWIMSSEPRFFSHVPSAAHHPASCTCRHASTWRSASLGNHQRCAFNTHHLFIHERAWTSWINAMNSFKTLIRCASMMPLRCCWSNS